MLGFVLVVGGAFFFDLRLLGLGRAMPVSGLATHLLTWARAGFALVSPTGFMMFTAHATEFAANPAFRLKTWRRTRPPGRRWRRCCPWRSGRAWSPAATSSRTS
jgi:hypothetical protein